MCESLLVCFGHVTGCDRKKHTFSPKSLRLSMNDVTVLRELDFVKLAFLSNVKDEDGKQ